MSEKANVVYLVSAVQYGQRDPWGYWDGRGFPAMSNETIRFAREDDARRAGKYLRIYVGEPAVAMAEVTGDGSLCMLNKYIQEATP